MIENEWEKREGTEDEDQLILVQPRKIISPKMEWKWRQWFGDPSDGLPNPHTQCIPTLIHEAKDLTKLSPNYCYSENMSNAKNRMLSKRLTYELHDR